jgi:DNA uptake protein ComE-like DNA-binding protein
MPTKIRINLANSLELLELPGLGAHHVDAIVRFRAEHGPIKDAHELAAILGAPTLAEALQEQADFSPADATAPEAPGA